MDAVYENFVRQIAGERLQNQTGDLREAVERDERRQKLQREIAALENKIRREKQFNIQVALNSELRRLKKELEV
jgi:23S rRNA maturation mini-RNase III